MTSRTPVRVVSLVSPLGGTGRTTLTAHLASFLTSLGHTCLAIDLCPQNTLGKHLGLQEPAEAGWARLASQRQWWGQAALSNSDGVKLLPFGSASQEALDALAQACARNPQWLRQQLDSLDLPAGSTIFLDTPTWPQPLARQALATASAVVTVLEASSRACQAQAALTQALAGASPHSRRAIVVNRVDPRRASHRQALGTLRTQWGDLLLPYTVHEDENIAQACQKATSVCTWAPYAQSSHDLQGIGRWLVGPLPSAPPSSAEVEPGALRAQPL